MASFLALLPQVGQSVSEMLVSIFTAISEIFVDTSGETWSVTFVGVILLVVMFIGLAILLLNWIRGVIRRD